MNRIQAVGFDLGETLVTYAEAPLNWASLYRASLQRVASALSAQVTEEQFLAAERVLARYNTRLNPRTVEVPADVIFKDALASWACRDAHACGTAIAGFFSFFQQSLRLYEDTLPALKALRAQGCRLGVLTDVPYGMPRSFVQQDLAQTQLTSLIDVLLTSVEVGFRKPDATGFGQLAASLSCTPAEMLYVGNEPKDIAGANAAGIASVLIDREGISPQLGQQFTVRSLSELAALVAH